MVEMITALKGIGNNKENDYNVRTMADALAYGYSGLRTTMILENKMREALSEHKLETLVSELAKNWDGASYIAGALRSANRHFVS